VTYPEGLRGGGEHPAADDQREVSLVEDLVILPDSTVDDTDAGWGERHWGNESRLLEDRPPHWVE